MRRFALYGLTLIILLFTLNCFSQQEFVSRYDAYGAYSYLETPSLNLSQHGFNGEFGYNWKRWVALGGDFTIVSGHTSLLPNQLNSATQAALAPYVPILMARGIPVALPYNSTTSTYMVGPQFNFRKFKSFTFFVRPGLGALHVSITAQPTNPIIAGIAGGMLGKSLSSSDTVVFYGGGGGFDFNASKHFGLRFAADYARFNMFTNFLNGGRNGVRITIGPTFRFGSNVPK
jgi:hypothetical protein